MNEYVAPSHVVSTDQYVTGGVSRRWSQTSWGSILAGVVCAIGLQFIFTLLGLAIGVSSAGPVDDPATVTVEGLGMAAAGWWLITGAISLMIGGVITGKLSGLSRSCELHLNALAMWAVVAIFGFGVIWSGAGIVSDAASPLATLAIRSAPTQAEYETMAGIPTDAARSPDGRLTDSAQREQARAVVKNHAEETRQAAQGAAWWAVGAMLLGVLAALVGAWVGAPERLERVRVETHVGRAAVVS
ncbi:MAG: hypothetical protein H7210_04215 [Pyrinomonadaceae bacterium]|nr:hypothetical protein [Phycisphaerales bacterium]